MSVVRRWSSNILNPSAYNTSNNKKKDNTDVSSVLCPLLQGSWAQVTRQPKGITVCWTRSRLCVGPVRTLQPSAATRYVSLCLARAPVPPVLTCSRCLTTRRATAGATPPKVQITWGCMRDLHVYLTVHVHFSSARPCEWRSRANPRQFTV